MTVRRIQKITRSDINFKPSDNHEKNEMVEIEPNCLFIKRRLHTKTTKKAQHGRHQPISSWKSGKGGGKLWILTIHLKYAYAELKLDEQTSRHMILL